jgi:hypothetical protein
MEYLSLKYFHTSVKFLLIFLITLLICFMLPGKIPGTVNIYINIEEIPAVGESFSFQIGTIVEIILMGPVFALVYFILMKNLLSKVDVTTGRNKKFVYILEILVVLFICTLVMGHITHLMFDYANAIYRSTYGGYDTTPLFLFLYHSDEWLGHHLIHISFFAFLVLAIIGESLISQQRTMKWYEILFAVPLGVGIFVMNGYATYEGQCGWLLMVLSAILLGIEGLVILVKKINPLKHPILFASIIANIVVIGYFIWYVSMFGTLPYYPFVPQ